MKKIIAFIVTLFLAACLLFSVSAADKITVMLDGSEIKFDVPPQIISGRTMVPIRAIFEALGAEVEWNDSTKTATATIDDYVVKCTLDSKYMNVRGKSVRMDVAPVIVNSRTLVPARYVAEAFGGKVGWDDKTRTVSITSAANLDVPVETGYLCGEHRLDARGYCEACGIASDYRVADIEDVPYIVTDNGAEMRARAYAVEKVYGRLAAGERITVTKKVTNVFGSVWYMAEYNGKKFLIYSGDVSPANYVKLTLNGYSDLTENSFKVYMKGTYTQKVPDRVEVYFGTSSDNLKAVAGSDKINGSNGAFTLNCTFGKGITILPDTVYYYQFVAISDGFTFNSEVGSIRTLPAEITTTTTTAPEIVEPEEPTEKFSGYQKGYGSAKTPWGKTVIVSIFVDDTESSWKNESASMQIALTKLNRAAAWISAQCRSYGADTEIICDWNKNSDLFYTMDFRNAPYSAQQAELIGKIDTAGLLKRYNADNIIYMLFFNNKFGISNSQTISKNSSSALYDIVNLYFKGQYDNADVYPDGEWISTYAHELSHCYGTYDLYRGSAGISEKYIEHLYAKQLEAYSNYYDIMMRPQVDSTFETNNYISELDAYYMGLVPYCADVDAWGLPKEGSK